MIETTLCKGCGTLMRPKRTDSGAVENRCPRCGNITLRQSSEGERVPMAELARQEKGALAVIASEDFSGETTTHNCPNCGNDRAALIEIKASHLNDEQGEFLFKCLRCKEVDRLKVTGY